jgi:hypothetical protein
VLFSVLLRFRKLESSRTPRKLPKSRRLSTRSLELKPELAQRLKGSWKFKRSVRIEL